VNIYYSIGDFPSHKDTIVTIGTFDGVHRGHQKIINRLNKIANREGLESVVLTFNPHPRHVIYPDDQKLRLIHTIEEKIEFLSNTGLQNLVLHKFTKEFSSPPVTLNKSPTQKYPNAAFKFFFIS